MEDGIKILGRVETLSRPAFVRPDLREFRLPIAKHVLFQSGEAAYFADPVKELTRLVLGFR